MDPLFWFASNQSKSDAVLRCPKCLVDFVAAGTPEDKVPRVLEPCGCIVCTKCATSMASKSPYTCPVHSQKLDLLQAHKQFKRAHRPVAAILLIDKLKKGTDVKAFPRSPKKEEEPATPSREQPLGGIFYMMIHFLGRHDSVKKQKIALKALHDMSKHPLCAEELAGGNGVPALVSIMGAGSSKLRLSAVETLRNCAAASQKCRDAIEASDAIPMLVQRLNVARFFASKSSLALQEAAVGALFEMAAKKSVSDKIVDAGGMKLLLRASRIGKPNTNALAAATLGKLAIDIDLLVKMASGGKIPPLVRLHSKSIGEAKQEEITVSATHVLARLASVPQITDDLVKTQAVNHIMKNLADPDESKQEEAVKGLAVIATNTARDSLETRGPMGAGLMGTIKQTLSPRKHGSPMTQHAKTARAVTLESQKSWTKLMEGEMTSPKAIFGMTMRLASQTAFDRHLAPGRELGRLGVVTANAAQAGIPALLSMVRKNNTGIQEQALAVLRDLAIACEHRNAIANAGGVQILADVLIANASEINSIHAASCLRSLAIDHDLAEEVAESGIMPCLVRMLTWDSIEAQDCSVGALANLSIVPYCKEMIADANAIERLIKMLGTTGLDEGVLNMVIGTLGNLATLKQNQVSIAAAGGIPPLVKLLDHTAPTTQTLSAGALWSLAQDTDNQARIAHWGGIPFLVALVLSDIYILKMNAIGCLRYLAENEENRLLISQAGGMKPLVKQFVDVWGAESELQELTCKCLLNLSISTGNQQEMIDRGCLPPALRFLLRGSLIAQEYAAGLLCNLASNSALQAAVAESGAVAGLVHVLDVGSKQAQGNAIEALRNLSMMSTCCRQIYQAQERQGIDLVVQQLCTQDARPALHAACVIANLAACNLSIYHTALTHAGALEALIALLKGGPEEQRGALCAIRNLSSDLICQEKLARAEAIPLIVAALKHPDIETRECAAAAVGNLAAGNCAYEDEMGRKRHVLDSLLDAVPALVRLCHKTKPGPAEDSAASAAGALWRMLAAEDVQSGKQSVRSAIVSVEGISSLELVLRTGSPRGKEYASKTLDLLKSLAPSSPTSPPVERLDLASAERLDFASAERLETDPSTPSEVQPPALVAKEQEAQRHDDKVTLKDQDAQGLPGAESKKGDSGVVQGANQIQVVAH